MVLEEVYRFDNTQVYRGGHDCWDLAGLWAHILAGLRACRTAGKTPSTLGIDTWAVDFVLLGADGEPVSDAVAYRDKRTEGMDAVVEQSLPFAELYNRTGIQKQPFNTIYQLAALRRTQPEQLAAADCFLMMPDYFHYRLTGRRTNEYTNATSTALVNARTKDWDGAVLDALGLPRRLFGPLSMPGKSVGRFLPAVREAVGFDCEVLLPATHDTGSAFLAAPARGGNTVIISSGTWSLLGVENAEPITSEASRLANFTNEGGYRCRFRYLKNIMGLWMIQSIRRELNGVSYVAGREVRAPAERQWSYAGLEAEARTAAAFPARINVSDSRFLAPNSMIRAVKECCAEAGGPVPESVGELMQCVYASLADSCAAAIRELSRLTGRAFTGVHIVGGGSKDGYLNELTARAAGLPVYAGPTEGTALGTLMVQFLRAGYFADLDEARAAVRRSFPIQTIDSY